MTENSIAIGFGNLDAHYGLISQIYFISAMFDISSLALGSQVANGFITIISIMVLLIFQKKSNHLILKNYVELSIFVLSLYVIYNSDFWFASPSPDLPAVGITLLSLALVLVGIEEKEVNLYRLGYYLSFVGFLFRPFLIIVSLTLYALIILNRKNLAIERKSLFINFNLLPAVIIFISSILKLLVTGFVFYPITIPSLNSNWQINKDIASNISKGINYWQQENFGLESNNMSQYSTDFFKSAIESDLLFTLTIFSMVIFLFFLLIDKIFINKVTSPGLTLISIKTLIFLFTLSWNVIFFVSPQMRFLWPFNWVIVVLIYSYLLFRIQQYLRKVQIQYYGVNSIFLTIFFIALLIFPFFENRVYDFKFREYPNPKIINLATINFFNKINIKDSLKGSTFKSVNNKGFAYQKALSYCGYQIPPCSRYNLEGLNFKEIKSYNYFFW
jgi:hypothetical protein